MIALFRKDEFTFGQLVVADGVWSLIITDVVVFRMAGTMNEVVARLRQAYEVQLGGFVRSVSTGERIGRDIAISLPQPAGKLVVSLCDLEVVASVTAPWPLRNNVRCDWYDGASSPGCTSLASRPCQTCLRTNLSKGSRDES